MSIRFGFPLARSSNLRLLPWISQVSGVRYRDSAAPTSITITNLFKLEMVRGLGGGLNLTGLGLCLDVCYFELLSQRSGRTRSQVCRWRRLCRRECSGTGLGMPPLESGIVVSEITPKIPRSLALTMKVVVFGPAKSCQRHRAYTSSRTVARLTKIIK